jgi:hypothetical protein
MVGVVDLACNAEIHRFDALPRHVCPGSRVEIVWDFTGEGTMTASPATPHAPSGRVAETGHTTIHPTVPTTVSLHVTRSGQPTGAQLDIEMAQGENIAASIADPSARCEGGVVSSTAHLSNISDLVVDVVRTTPGDKRAGYEVAHAGTSARITPAASTSFAGRPLAGDWVISSPLLPGETCDPAAPKVPDNLVVVAYTRCEGSR